ncbi:MAG: wax ester/triacylglycerol synthase family O-acyltransferase [Deltaproteobacteria bacterium]|nr:wax ester/triacylglycerol synthase family O-acyltransferase [Deltaproteobacteria bacterium]MBT8466240.1 wax ester/triacylglycerol synthase family O-acyltransferase [Deltaproteobacteria bacterium]NND28095.1 wax ester/triacylglycerol synthase family O-acyltransferase [Myxococcales bacterium]NNK07158.1 wax ester/triacylglycerol synthase family O-acyltransferase [Myxococcales bacterium]NNK42357.1 wax ester/triacylglycerol synthase family O-acyltransferase [Myxococcales bacterium]
MQPLSGLDSSFLYLEDARQPMHVGSVLVFEGSMDFESFRQTMASRVHLVPRLRQRLAMVPFGIGKPYWVEDPEFNLDMHLQHVALPSPGSWKELRGLAARIFSVPLDRSRPLWEMTFVEGLDQIPQVPPGSVALINKTHHAAIDGVSGADMMGILLDMTKEPRVFSAPPPRTIPPVPNELEVLSHTARKIMGKPSEIKRVAGELTDALRAAGKVRDKGVEVPPVPMTAPPTPINHTITGQRIWNTALLELDRVKAIRKITGCTLNDVVLAICAGALRRYLDEKGELPAKPLIAMVPVSTRGDDERGKMGNKVSAMFLDLATDVADPVERLKVLKEHTQGGKAFEKAGATRAFVDLWDFVPFGLANRVLRLYSRFRVSELHNPVFNVVITNVPGPQMDLYMAGHKLLASMGMAPLVDGMGLLITVLSYNGVLSISPTSSPAVMPDLDVFTRYLRESANELEAAVLPHREPDAEAGDAHAEAVAQMTAAFVAQMRSTLEEAPDDRSLREGKFQLRITGAGEQTWMIDMQDRSVTEGNGRPADATLTILDAHLAEILRGNLDPQIAFVQGKLRVEGDINKAIEFGSFLPKVIA